MNSCRSITDEALDIDLQRRLRLLADQISVPDVDGFSPRSRFRFGWPRFGHTKSEAGPRRDTRTAMDDHTGGAELAAQHILVVEDDTATRQVVTEALSDEGFAVVGAQDGAQALRLAAVTHPDLIVLDLGLPVLDGPGFASRWRERADSAGVPIVVMSGRPEGRATAKAMSAAAFLSKPLDLHDLAELSRLLLATSSRPLAGVHASPGR